MMFMRPSWSTQQLAIAELLTVLLWLFPSRLCNTEVDVRHLWVAFAARVL